MTKHTKALLTSEGCKKRGGDNGKRKPITDDMGMVWCNCTRPNLISTSGGPGQAYCLKCHQYYYH